MKPAGADDVPGHRAFGPLLRQWRHRRRLSQLELALDAGVSARHVSFVETGRSRPSREMVLRLADQLDVPLRDRDPLLIAAGHAPEYPMRSLDHAEMAPVRRALRRVLDAYAPYPALAVDRSWNLVLANSTVGVLTEGVAADLLEAPVNVLRMSLHPSGLAPRIANLAQWRGHVLRRLAREARVTGDTGLVALHRELAALPGGVADDRDDLAVPLRLRHRQVVLSLLGIVTTFGTAVDVTTAELSVEAFLPADAATAAALHGLTVSAGAPTGRGV